MADLLRIRTARCEWRIPPVGDGDAPLCGLIAVYRVIDGNSRSAGFFCQPHGDSTYSRLAAAEDEEDLSLEDPEGDEDYIRGDR